MMSLREWGLTFVGLVFQGVAFDGSAGVDDVSYYGGSKQHHRGTCLLCWVTSIVAGYFYDVP